MSKPAKRAPSEARDAEARERIQAHALAELQAKHEAGDPLALLRALEIVLTFQRPAPEWVARAFAEGLRRFERFESATLDHAFGIKRETRANTVARLRKRHTKGFAVACAFAEAERAGRSLNDELADEIAERFAMSAREAWSYWHEAADEARGFLSP
jgi:hypothetical protein